MNLIPNAIYLLSGDDFCKFDLDENEGKFKYVRYDDEYWVFTGVKNGVPQYAKQEWLDAGTANIQAVKADQPKRKKGERNKAPTVNKAKITFLSGESYTVKDFVSIESTAEKIVFIMEDNWKGTVNYRQAITVPNDDVDTVVVRGVKDRFELDMALTNMGVTILRSDNAEILASELNIKL